MDALDDKYVYHGSPIKFDLAIPKRQIRSKMDKDGNRKTTFDEVSFHATPHRWIALAYAYQPKQSFELEGKKYYYNVGISLYERDQNWKKVLVYGLKPLEETLKKLYGKPGYLLTFDGSKFSHMNGLGDFEVITKEKLKPLSVEKIDNPVEEMKKEGVNFELINLADPKNIHLRELAT